METVKIEDKKGKKDTNLIKELEEKKKKALQTGQTIKK